MTEAEKALERLRDDYGFFLRSVWKDRQLERKAPLSWVELDLADWGAHGDGTPATRFRQAMALRTAGKTYLITAMLTCWRLFRDPERKIVIVSKSQSHAKKIGKLIRDWLDEVWFLQHLRPNSGAYRNQTDTTTQFQVGPAVPSVQLSVTVLGIDGQLPGQRAHSVFADDVETDSNTATPEAREKLDKTVGEFKDWLYNDSPDSVDRTEIVYIGTYHHEESLYLKLANRGYTVRSWPIAAPQRDDRINGLAPKIKAMLDSGELAYTANEQYQLNPLLPHRFGESAIIDRMKEGRTRFAMQSMLIANLGDTARYPLRLSDLIVMDLHRDKAPVTVAYGQSNQNGSTVLSNIQQLGFGGDFLRKPAMIDSLWAPYARTVVYIDPAGRGTDLTGLAIVGALNGQFFVKGLYGLQGGIGQAELANIARLAKLHGAREGWYESNNDDFNAFGPLLEVEFRKLITLPNQDPDFPDGWSCSLLPHHATRQKELRIIETIEPLSSTHRLILDTAVVTPDLSAPTEHAFQYQFSRITKQRGALREDAKLDALEGALQKLTGTAYVDPQANREHQLDYEYEQDRKMLDRLKDSAMGHAPRPARWYTPSWKNRKPQGRARY